MPDIEVTTGVNTAGFKSGLDELRAYSEATFSGISGLASGLVGAFSINTVVSFAKGIFDLAGRIEDLSERFGVSTKFIQEWSAVGEESGVTMEDLALDLNKLAISISRANAGNADALEHFRALGVSAADLKNLTPEEIWTRISHSSMEAADMVAIFGRNALALIPVLKAVADGSSKLGKAIDDDLIKKIDTAGDRWTRVMAQGTVRGGTFLGQLVKIGEKLEKVIPMGILMNKLTDDGSGADGGQVAAARAAAAKEKAQADAASAVSLVQREESLRSRLAKLDEERAERQRSNEEQRNVLLARRNEILNMIGEGGLDEEAGLKASVALAENRNEIDAVNVKITHDQAAAAKEVANERQKSADAAERAAEAHAKEAAVASLDLADSRENTRELEAQLSGHEEIAKQLKIAYDFEKLIAEARAAGHTALAEQLTTEKNLNLEVEKRAAAEKKAAAEQQETLSEYYARAAKAGFTVGNTESLSAGHTTAQLGPKARALQAAGFFVTEAALNAARDPHTGAISDDALARAIVQNSQATGNGTRNLSFAEQLRSDQLARQFSTQQAAQAAANTVLAAAAAAAARSALGADITRNGAGNSTLLQQILAQLQSTHQVITPPPG